MNFRVSNIWNNKALTITHMQMIITKVRFWTRHTRKIRRYMMISTCIRKPSNKSSCKGIIKYEIGIGLERMSSQPRALLGSMPIFITQLTLYIAIIPTKRVTLLSKISCCLRGRTSVHVVQISDLRYNYECWSSGQSHFHDCHDKSCCDCYISNPHENNLVC